MKNILTILTLITSLFAAESLDVEAETNNRLTSLEQHQAALGSRALQLVERLNYLEASNSTNSKDEAPIFKNRSFRHR